VKLGRDKVGKRGPKKLGRKFLKKNHKLKPVIGANFGVGGKRGNEGTGRSDSGFRQSEPWALGRRGKQ